MLTRCGRGTKKSGSFYPISIPDLELVEIFGYATKSNDPFSFDEVNNFLCGKLLKLIFETEYDEKIRQNFESTCRTTLGLLCFEYIKMFL